MFNLTEYVCVNLEGDNERKMRKAFSKLKTHLVDLPVRSISNHLNQLKDTSWILEAKTTHKEDQGWERGEERRGEERRREEKRGEERRGGEMRGEERKEEERRKEERR